MTQNRKLIYVNYNENIAYIFGIHLKQCQMWIFINNMPTLENKCGVKSIVYILSFKKWQKENKTIVKQKVKMAEKVKLKIKDILINWN